MIRALTMPAWGMEDAAGTVVNWLVNEGDSIALGQELVEIETTKLTNVVESPFVGTLTKVVLQKGDQAPTGSLLAVVVDGETSPGEIDSFIADFKQPDASAVEVNPVERFIDTSAGKIRVMTQAGGPATPVLLLHGYGADWTNWSFLFRGLAQKRVVHMLDLPGHGGSFKDLGAQPLVAIVDAVVETARALGEPLHLVGHSLGGLVAVGAAAKKAQIFKSVSLIAPVGIGGSINEPFLEAFANADSRKNARSALQMLVSDRDAISLTMINDVIRARRVEGAKEALHAIRKVLADSGKQAIDMRAELATLRQPVQLILGEQDQIVGVDGRPTDATACTTLPGTGHLVHIEKASAVQELVNSFMERNDG